MRTINTIILVVALQFVQVFVHAQGQKEVTPDKFIGSIIIAASKNYVYYPLSEKSKTELTLTGPGDLTVFTRVRMVDTTRLSDPFVLKTVTDGGSVSTNEIVALRPSSKYSFKSSLEGTPTVAAKSVIHIPPGKHKIVFYKAKTGQPVHARYLYKQFNKPVWKDLKPTEKLEQVKLVYEGGKETPNYYRITDKESFSFSISDTARIRILVRDEFTYKMFSENYMRLEVTESGKDPVAYKFLSRRSKNVSYSEVNSLVPSNLHDVYLDLPKATGKRVFTLKAKGLGRSAIIRISTDTNLIPKP